MYTSNQVPAVQINFLSPHLFPTLKKTAAHSSEMLISVYQTTWHGIPTNHNASIYHSLNPKFNTASMVNSMQYV